MSGPSFNLMEDRPRLTRSQGTGRWARQMLMPGPMRVLLVYPEFPTTYWGFQFSLPLIFSGATLPPLGLISVAAMLPDSWDLRLVDLNIEALEDEALSWAEVVLVSGMLVQEASMHDILRRARSLGRRTILGGPACTSSPELFPEADHLFLGEVEGRAGELWAAMKGEASAPRVLPEPLERPALTMVPVPRFDLLKLPRYRSMSLQTSRGCPYQCEFCDIVVRFGRVPRVKTPPQVLAELDALYGLGYRGDIFVVDDNFIGNKARVRPILSAMAAWQDQQRRPFSFYTEASLNLAADDELIALMLEASFYSVFIGIETPDAATLKHAGKLQNVRVDVRAAVDKLTRAGFEVMGGFIVGFDGDGPESFEAQLELLRDLPVPLAMVGLLTAFPGTPLYQRLEAAGRLRAPTGGDAFARTNFEPTMPEAALVAHYGRLLTELYSPDTYFRRSAALVERVGKPRRSVQLRGVDVRIALNAVLRLGLLGRRRTRFWRLLLRGLRRGVSATRSAITCAVMGEHLQRYTEEIMIPRLTQALHEIGDAPRPAAIRPRQWSRTPPAHPALSTSRPGPTAAPSSEPGPAGPEHRAR